MKKILLLLIPLATIGFAFIGFLIFVLSGHGTDNFYGTNRYIKTDKDIYNIGDSFEITMIIQSDVEKKIRMHKNYKNLRIWTGLVKNDKYIQKGSWTKNNDSSKKHETFDHTISKDKPFKKTFIGQIKEDGGNIILEVPELNLTETFLKTKFSENSTIKISGHVRPISPEIGASMEEYFESKDIQILLNN